LLLVEEQLGVGKAAGAEQSPVDRRADARSVRRGQTGQRVDVTGQEGLHRGTGVGEQAEVDAIQPGRLEAVAVASQGHEVAGNAVHPERP
jgi:hypothetical protein